MMESLACEPISAIADVPGLYISDITVPRSSRLLQKYGITHVLSLTEERICHRIDTERGIQQLHVAIGDNPFEDLIITVEGLCAWIKDAISKGTTSSTEPTGSGDVVPRDPRVLVHCVQGISRSGAIIVAYLMKTFSLDYDSALALAQKSRPLIYPNSGFADQLRLWHRMGFTVFEGPGSTLTKPEYDTWKENRGILLSKGEMERQKVLISSMAEMAARFGSKRLEQKGGAANDS